MTNYDDIKRMSPVQIATLILLSPCRHCAFFSGTTGELCGKRCRVGIVKWLGQEAEENYKN